MWYHQQAYVSDGAFQGLENSALSPVAACKEWGLNFRHIPTWPG